MKNCGLYNRKARNNDLFYLKQKRGKGYPAEGKHENYCSEHGKRAAIIMFAVLSQKVSYLLFGYSYIILFVELCESVCEVWNICLVRKRQRNGAYQNVGYRNFARETAYLAFQKSAICGSFQRTVKNLLTGGKKICKNFL